MKRISDIIKYFTFITTGIVILFILIMLVQHDEALDLSTLIEITALGLITSLITVFLYPFEMEKINREYLLRILLHYTVLCAAASVFGISFGWITFSFGGIVLMMISVAGIYVFTYAVAYMTAVYDAEELNRALKDKRKDQ